MRESEGFLSIPFVFSRIVAIFANERVGVAFGRNIPALSVVYLHIIRYAYDSGILGLSEP